MHVDVHNCSFNQTLYAHINKGVTTRSHHHYSDNAPAHNRVTMTGIGKRILLGYDGTNQKVLSLLL